MLSNARNRYLLRRIEKTLEEVIAAQQAIFNRSRYRPNAVGVAFGEGAAMPPLSIQTPAGAELNVLGRIDRIDRLPDSQNAIAIDYKLGGQTLSLQDAYHGLSLTLLADLLALQGDGKSPTEPALTPVAAFYVQMLRSFNDVDHPDELRTPPTSDIICGSSSRNLRGRCAGRHRSGFKRRPFGSRGGLSIEGRIVWLPQRDGRGRRIGIYRVARPRPAADRGIGRPHSRR